MTRHQSNAASSLDSAGRARLAALRRGELRTAGAARVPHTGRTRAPLSPGQQRIWFLNEFLSNKSVYNIAGSYRLTGDLSLDGLQHAIDALVERHASLRTHFAVVDGLPTQIVEPVRHVDVAVRDTAPRELAAELEQFFRAPFDLTAGPLLRVMVSRTGKRESVLSIVIHHIIADGWSLGVFIREFVALYTEFVTGSAAGLPEPEITYVDYSLWLRTKEHTGRRQAHVDFWTDLLADRPRLIEIPTDRPRPAVQSFNGARFGSSITADLRQRVEKLAQAQGATPYMALLTAYFALLQRWSGQRRLTCATPVANRLTLDVESVIGFFVNTLVLPANLDGRPTFSDLLEQVRETCVTAFAHQELPFEQLVDGLSLNREPSHNPLAQVMFILQSAPAEAMSLPGMTLEPTPVDTGTSKFDITLELIPTDDGYDIVVEYASDLFDTATIHRFCGHYVRLLESMVTDPAKTIESAPILTDAECAELARWNATDDDTGYDSCAHDWIARQVDTSGDRTALVTAEGQEISYRLLAARVGRLAHFLQTLGVGPDVPVGLCLRRGPEMVVGLVGILVAGGAYVPFDPGQPAGRIGRMVREGRIGVVLTTSGCMDALDGLPDDVRVVLLDDADTERTLAAQDGTWPARATGAHDLAYVIYTSGSTGTPKGVMVEHRSIVNRVNWMQQQYRLRPDDRVMQKTTYTFDVSVWEFLWPLMHGATLVLARPDAHREPTVLLDDIRRLRVTHIHFVPTALSALLSLGSLRGTALRRIFCSGDALPGELCARTFADCGIAIENLYGPTECAIDVTYWSWQPGRAGSPPIGRPVVNTRVHVVDAAGNELPVGAAGELWIAGVQVARGYLNRPDLTRERFLPDPFSGRAGERVYRTGDLVRRREDGALDFLGRIDDQVKVRGFRVELGEVEAALREEPGVLDATAICRTDASGEKQLIAYLVADPGWVPASNGVGDRVDGWSTVFDRAYTEGEDVGEPGLNLKGWVSSYTHQPIPRDEMVEWLESAIVRIKETGARSFLEIGCGTGLFALRLAAECDRYVGVDIAQHGLDHIAAQAERLGLDNRIELLRLAADDLAALDGREFDCVIINSVLQYFPDREYLDNVLTTAIGLLADGGHVFVGDVRALPLAETFHYSVAQHEDPGAGHEHLLARAARRTAEETELLVDPSYFTELIGRVPGVSRVETCLKRGRTAGELTDFRYDVLIERGGEPSNAVTEYADWDSEVGDMKGLVERFAGLTRGHVAVDGIPNARLRRHMPAADAPGAVHPDDLWELADAHGLRLQLTWSPSGAAEGTMAAVFRVDGSRAVVHHRPADARTNDPARGMALRELPQVLRRRLREKLPDYMVPASLVVLPELPVTSSGKVDRSAVADIAEERYFGVEHTAPRTTTERAVAEIWCDVLNLPVVAVQDNFFDLGGDSIKSTQVAARLRDAGWNIPIRSIFANQTVERLAEHLDMRSADDAPETNVIARDGVVRSRYRLSPLQRHMVRLLPGRRDTGLYVVQRILRYDGEISPDTVGRAWAATVRRTPFLRTVLREADGEIHQEVVADAGNTVACLDWSDRTDQRALLTEFLRADRAAGFDAATPPPTRFTFIRLADKRGVWVITMDYRRLDGWSFPLYLGRFLANHRAVGRGVEAPAEPADTFDYADYLAWREHQMSTGKVAEWWREQAARLDHLPTVPAADRSAESFDVAQVRLGPKAMRRFAATCRRLKVTQAAAVQALWGAVIQHLDGRAAPQFGVTTSGRSPEIRGIENAMGMFMNTLPIRWQSGPADSVKDWLHRASASVLNLIEHDMIGLTEVEAMAMIDGTGSAGLFDSYLVYQNTPSVAADEASPDGFTLVDDPPMAIAQQEHRLRVDLYPSEDGNLDILLSGYEPTDRLHAYLGTLRDLLLNVATYDAEESMAGLLAASTPPNAPRIVPIRLCVEAIVDGVPLPHDTEER